jgi:hypothetical protein
MCVVAEFTINCVLGQPIPPRLVTPAVLLVVQGVEQVVLGARVRPMRSR